MWKELGRRHRTSILEATCAAVRTSWECSNTGSHEQSQQPEKKAEEAEGMPFCSARQDQKVLVLRARVISSAHAFRSLSLSFQFAHPSLS
jgi:hypothetical protein